MSRLSLTFGEMPDRPAFDEIVADEPYSLTIRNPALWTAVAAIINQGIDSHLEAVACRADHTTGEIVFDDRSSLWTFLRRCTESDRSERRCDCGICRAQTWGDMGEDEPINLANSIMSTLDIEWI